MKYIKINLNNHIKVKLNNNDKQRVIRYYNEHRTPRDGFITIKDVEKKHNVDGYYEFQHHEFISIFGVYVRLLDDLNVLMEVEDDSKDTNITIGVGDGTGQLFVHGNYESIKILQEKLLELEKLRQYFNDIESILAKAKV